MTSLLAGRIGSYQLERVRKTDLYQGSRWPHIVVFFLHCRGAFAVGMTSWSVCWFLFGVFAVNSTECCWAVFMECLLLGWPGVFDDNFMKCLLITWWEYIYTGEQGKLVRRVPDLWSKGLRFWIPAGAVGEFSSPELTLCADSYSVSVPPQCYHSGR